MKRKTKAGALLPLMEKLRACPSKESCHTPEQLMEHWKRVGEQEIQNDKPTLSIIAALVLDSTFASLLTKEELSQFTTLARSALDRYAIKNKTPKVGRILFDCIKEES